MTALFSGKFVAFSFLGMIGATYLMSLSDRLRSERLELFAVSLTFALASYCAVAGALMIPGWHDPFATASNGELGRAAGTHGGRGGLVILAIRFLPWFLLLFCGYMAVNAGRILWRIARERRRAGI
jgi:hypothetical protein